MAAIKTKRRTSRSRLNGPLPDAADKTQVLTLSEAATFLRVSEAALLHLATLQEVPGRKIGDDWRFSKTALQDWLGAAAPRRGLLSQIGALQDDPHREEMLKEIYAQRGRPETEGR
jgi:excisionase family DNA binding protein